MSNLRKSFKKIGALFMSLCMVMAMGATAFAADTSTSDTGSITISNLDGGVTASAYQIAKGTYDDEGNFLGYEMTVSGNFDLTFAKDGSYNESALTEENLAELWKAVENNEPTGSTTVDVNGTTATISNLPIGAYLIAITGSTGNEATIYMMMIGSVYYATDEDGNWSIVNGAIDIEGSNLWAKSAVPQLTKTEVGGSIDDEDWSHGGSADLGDTIEYHITIGPTPQYLGEYPEYYVEDHISSELTITEEELAALYVMDANGNIIDSSNYTVTRTDDGFKIDFVVNGKYTLNSYAGQDIVIDFCADVTSLSGSAEADDHNNIADLTYSTTSYVAGNEGFDEDEDHDYTFTVQTVKTDADGNVLAGAEFALYTDADCTTPYTQNGQAVTGTSASDGSIVFTGLQEGTYYLKETKAPAGYAINDSVYTVTITAQYTQVHEKEQGEISDWNITITSGGQEVSSIVNTKVGALPSMGGMGTMIFTIVGCVLIFGALCGVMVYRRRRA